MTYGEQSTITHETRHGLNVCVPQNAYAEFLMLSVMVSGGGAFGRLILHLFFSTTLWSRLYCCPFYKWGNWPRSHSKQTGDPGFKLRLASDSGVSNLKTKCLPSDDPILAPRVSHCTPASILLPSALPFPSSYYHIKSCHHIVLMNSLTFSCKFHLLPKVSHFLGNVPTSLWTKIPPFPELQIHIS